ncbi:MAG TPA: DUF4340 domain-containing protein, partial [Rhizomicrobium sp.]|nr:DUF4340 domain-containing protein [Rhizomicrobium sp.]
VPMAETVFPGLAHQLRDVAKIHIASLKGGTFDVVFNPEQGWTLPQRDNYPASFEQVRKTITAMATLQRLEPRTARVDWLRYLDLDPPSSGGHGVLITLSDDKGNVLASLITGKAQDIGDASGLSGIFVRKPDSTQSWLARGTLQIAVEPAEWVNRLVLDLDRARIREVDVIPASGPAFSVLRNKKSDADFRLAQLPKGRTLLNAQSPNGVAVSAVGFTFDDLRAARDFDFANASRVTTRTFDGLIVTIRVIAQGADHWATLSAEAAPGRPAMEKEARRIDARSDGWAYKLPAYKGQQLMTTLDSLLTPLGPKAKPAP